MKCRLRYQRYQTIGAITESTVTMVSPWLERLKLCDPPYVVTQERFWLVLLESKRCGVVQALPQTLAYMMANPNFC
jgi:hypothetical protein